MSDYETRPTIETVLEEMRSGFVTITMQFAAVHERLDRIEARLDRLDRRQSNQDAKLDDFIQEVIDLKRELRHPV